MPENEITCEASEAENKIRIDPSDCAIEVEIHNSKMTTFTITNNNTLPIVLQHVRLRNSQNCQVTLSNVPNKNCVIKPNEPLDVSVSCKGNFIGLSGEICIFHFQDFIIRRKIELNVSAPTEMNNIIDVKKNVPKESKKKTDLKLHAPELSESPKFVFREETGACVLPKRLKRIEEKILMKGQNFKAAKQYAPYLKDNLNYNFYSKRFHMLLDLEELELRISFRKYNLNEVYLTPCDDFFFLEVPNLMERHPSTLVGSYIILTQPWSEEKNIEYKGYIHMVIDTGVFIRLYGSLHGFSDECECNVNFIPNMFFLSRCREAVTRAEQVLGEKWLFPSEVNEKPSYVEFCVEESKEVTEEKSSVQKDATNNDGAIKKSKNVLKWVNASLNDRQKLAVVNVLKGVGRPLPYIIFGPPGTGKTVTLVEIILQIYKLIPDSRILVTTPSNTAADLICLRLKAMVEISPKELIRVTSKTTILQKKVLRKLRPHTALYRKSASRKPPIKGMNQFTGKHRITVTTCACSGKLHFYGFAAGHFTHILVDEAGQTVEPEVLIPATFLNKESAQLVLAGDPEQLGPRIHSNISKFYGFGESLLQRFIKRFPYAKDFKSFPDTSGFDPRFVTRLNVNYRSVPEILTLYSQMFYNSDLIPTVSQTEGADAKIIKKFNFKCDGRNTPAAIIFHGIIGKSQRDPDSTSWYNPQEIIQVILYLKQLYAAGLTPNDIGIVTPYTKQAHRLTSALSAMKLALPKIGTAEEHQGQENKATILTTVRSSQEFNRSSAAHLLEFIGCPKRLNVCISRARALLIIVGNPVLLSYDPHWLTVIKYCIKNKSYTGCNLDYFPNNLGLKSDEGEKSNKEGGGENKVDQNVT